MSAESSAEIIRRLGEKDRPMTDAQRKLDLVNRLVALLDNADVDIALDAAWIAMQIVGGNCAAAVVRNYCDVSSDRS